MKRIFSTLFLSICALSLLGQNAKFVDPRIGSEGVGRVFIGPSCPYGMVKPSPDCTSSNNSGWAPMPTQVNGFGQVHVSGTGGGPKYGNILIMPFSNGEKEVEHIDFRTKEDISLGYYATKFEHSGIEVKVTTAERASIYDIAYSEKGLKGLSIDAGFYLGQSRTIDGREAQQFVGSEIQVLNNHAVSGYSRVRGGWNNGKAYTVYFYIEADKDFEDFNTWEEKPLCYQTVNDKTIFSKEPAIADNGNRTGVNLLFPKNTENVKVKVGISFLSVLKAKQNADRQINGFDFDGTYNSLLDKWGNILDRVSLSADTPDSYKRMFYTGLYHTMIMPVDRTGENPGWNDMGVPYYDDFYAIWDTYRTSSPLITLLDPQREIDIVNSLLNIYKRDGYMPDARSGNSNGRTQGGSNAEIVIADAFAKGLGRENKTSADKENYHLSTINYELALEAMLKDATTPPGGNEEAEGRGGLREYLEYGYIPYGIARAGNRTTEYAFCDWAIAQVAKGLGKNALYEQYMRQADNWKNLWRADYQQDGVKGFILPRDKDGKWLDRVPFGHSKLQSQTFEYAPNVSYEGPWYVAWWDCFFYEASSWEYSLSVPHDIPALIEMCGGKEAFDKRLDTFFEHNYYNVANEPSFLTPCLYHWIGRPDKTSDRVRQIIRNKFNDTPTGIPGNDDSGAMSSWLAFHMMGLYPNAGLDYYLIHTPLVKETTLNLTNGRKFVIKAPKLSDRNFRIKRVLLNGNPIEDFRITHQQILEGGELLLEMVKGTETVSEIIVGNKQEDGNKISKLPAGNDKTLTVAYSLHGQRRVFDVPLEWRGDSLVWNWGIQRNLDYWTGSYTMTPEALDNASCLSYEQPLWGNHFVLSDKTFGILSRKALREIRQSGSCTFNGTTWNLIPSSGTTQASLDGKPLLTLSDTQEGATMMVVDDERLPLIVKMTDNPVEINWEITIKK